VPRATTQVAFLRAVNLGKRRVEMRRLVAVLERLGYENVWTFVNSGNAVFDGAGTRAAVERTIEHALHDEFGFEIETFVRTAAELRRIVADTPFRMVPGDTHFVTFLEQPLKPDAQRALEALSNDYDTLVVRGRDVHWRMHGLSSASTLRKKDWKIAGDASTSRNMNMLRRLVAKLDGRS
jgi:uncharacterized protein (DUF1697 family)